MTGRPAVAVTGLGAVTPAGTDVGALWRAVCEGRSTATRDPGLAGLPVDFSCRVPEPFEPTVGHRQLWRLDRFTTLALAAADEAVRDAGLSPATWDGARVGVVVGCGLGGAWAWEAQYRRLAEQGPESVSPLVVPMVIPNMAAGEIALVLGARGPSVVTATACASGASALAVAHGWLTQGLCDVVVAGGAESGSTPLMVTGFHRAGALSARTADPAAASRPFAADRDGFVMAEAAAVLVLERAEDARARRVRPRALLAGCGAATDAYHPTAPDPTGRGAEAAVRAALATAGLAPDDIGHVNAHGTSTPQGDAVEARLIARVFPHGPSVTSAKGALGHALGAAGAVEAVLTVLSLRQGTVPPTANTDAPDPALPDLDLVVKAPRTQDVVAAVSHSFGFGGHNVCLAFTRP
ncbi:beta-ketoacyl-[acyl-carrier-protein] synthase family protein [Streptomyces triculaminicus]|uniref:Beta-ketoacyl-[acyl-carrier-protein] synthase family protein n=1 Tax=Streptomyces triculaminicus TaxID=2816232 RepID=A0A939FT54_9ACTN|nr:beta-ketoacyl-[acyl-carrier-protein] synthase family protein [Streptomyces triculaminicus]MBO0657443.1 beta-ketoacyl-[acyl-carrier-protein] synthase family protein [Streptomyces triculaminicus]